jgi:thiol-activated cytolysin
MESDSIVSDADLAATMTYSSGTTTAEGSLETKYKSIRAKSTITIITIGGNADTTSYAVDAENLEDLKHILTGSNAVYSKDNPGVPIAYTVKFLKDNKVAKMGYTTDYTVDECNVSKGANISFKTTGAVTTYAYISYSTWDKKPVSWSSGGLPIGDKANYRIPGGSTGIRIRAKTSCFGDDRWAFDTNPESLEDACYEIRGTVCFPDYDKVKCN